MMTSFLKAGEKNREKTTEAPTSKGPWHFQLSLLESWNLRNVKSFAFICEIFCELALGHT